MDFSLVEVSNYFFESEVNSGAKRLEIAGECAVPQIVAPGGLTVVDAKTWDKPPKSFESREFRPHNRLITCAALEPEERGEIAKIVGKKFMNSKVPTEFIMPHGGFDDWDKEGECAFDKNAIETFYNEIKKILDDRVEFHEIDQNIYVNNLSCFFSKLKISQELCNPLRKY